MVGPRTSLSSFLLIAALVSLPYSACCAQAASAPSAAEEAATDTGSEINIRNADIAAVVRIFSKKTKRNFILDERVKGTVSLYLPGKVSDEDSLRILDSVLSLKGFTSVPIGENLWKIVPSKEAIQTTIPTIGGTAAGTDSPSSSMVTRLFPLKYIGAEDAKQILTPLVSSEGLLNAYTGTNSLILIDSEDNIERLLKIIESLDVPSSDSEMSIIPIENAEAIDIADKLNQILGSSDKEDAGNPIDQVRARMQARVTAARIAAARARANSGESQGEQFESASGETISPRTRAPKIIPDERTNSLIVVADEDTTTRIRALVSQLDSEVDRSGFRFYVYQCEHADAEEIASVLGGLSGDSVNSSSRNSSTLGGLQNSGPGNRQNSSLSSAQNRLASQSRSPGQSRLANQNTSSGPTSVSLGENLSITADPSTNSLVIFSSKSDYEKLLELLQKIDVKRRQVLVEAVLLEVSVDDSKALGTEFMTSAGGKDGGIFAQSSFGGNLAQLIADPTQLSNFTVAAASSGTLTLPGNITIPTQTVLLNAAANNSDVNILSAPNILATDNEPAEIVVGQNVPFLASTATSGDNLNNVFNTVDRQDVGITLRITPQISSTDTVQLSIFTEVSNVVQGTLDSTLGPTTTVRTSETTVISKNNQMIVIGGLMSDGRTEVDTGVPFLKDIPVLGYLFRSSSESVRKTNLLIFITPRILKDQFDAREATVAHREGLNQEILAGDMSPSREEVLFNPDIDRVTKAEVFKGDLPSTITPPAPPSTSRQGQPSVAEDVLEFRIPSKAPAATSREVRALHGVTVVLELSKSDPIPDSVPFFVEGSKRLVGLSLPAEVIPEAKTFFQAGNRYTYAVDNKELSLQVLGTFGNPEEAAELFPELKGHWYTLSPYEIMKLGDAPWRMAH